jgi:UDP-N-acetylmuramate-alanine ligase
VVHALDRVAAAVAALAAPGDLVITLGAGSIGGVAAQVVSELERLHGQEAAS